MLKINAITTASLLSCCFVAVHVDAGLIGHWTLDENPAANGASVADSSGATVHNGTLATGLSNASVAGQVGTAFDFSNDAASNVVIDLDADIVSGSGPATVTMWINPDDLGGQQFIFAWGKSSAGQNARLSVEPGSGGTELRYRHQGGYVGFDAASITNTSGWHHIAYVIPNSASTVGDILVYVDGAIASVVTPDNDLLNIDTTANKDFNIASNFSGSGFDGQIDDVGYWDEALDLNTIQAIYQGGLQGNDLQASIPEPSSLALIGLGGLCLLRRRR